MTTQELELTRDLVIAAKENALVERREKTPLSAVRALANMQAYPRSILNVVPDGTPIALIGQIRHHETYDPVGTALRLVRNGVDAVSIFTDERVYTRGLDDLLLVSRGVSKSPVICQDYLLDEYHVAEARAAGASAVMLYTDIHERGHLRKLVSIGHRWKMTTILQVSTVDALVYAHDLMPHVVAVGHHLFFEAARDLPLLRQVRQQMPYNTLLMPYGCVHNLDDVRAVVGAGVHALMVDEQLCRQPERFLKLRTLVDEIQIAR